MDVSSGALTGDQAEKRLDAAGITCNKNPVPFDSRRPAQWRGVRLGVCAVTTRGFGVAQLERTGQLIAALLRGADAHAIRAQVQQLCADFPIYGERDY